MPEDKKLDELFQSRNDHEKRLSVVETNISHIMSEQTEIKDSIKDNHTAYMGSVRDIQDTIKGFVTDINGIPKQNQKELEDIKEHHCRPMAKKVDNIRFTIAKWAGAISVVVALIGFLVNYLIK